MRNLNKIAALGLSGLILTGCADTTIDYLMVDKPQSIADYEYLDAYASLKEYKTRSVNPGFLLGTGINASDYVARNLPYRVTNANFDIMTPYNVMKYASIVNDKGEMDFGNVESLVDAAESYGMQIYGNTLCWHAQQNTKWLNKLIADREIEVDPDAVNLVEDITQTYDGLDKFPYFVMGFEPDMVGGILTCQEGDKGWFQFFAVDGVPYVEGRTYVITTRIKGSKAGSLNANCGNWDAAASATIEFTEDWEEVTVKVTSPVEGNGFVVFQPGVYDGKLEIDWVKVCHEEAPAMEIAFPLISGGDAADGECANLVSRVYGKEDFPAPVVNDPQRGPVFKSDISARVENEWDCQFFIRSNEPLEAGEKVKVHFWYRADDSRNISTQAHGEPGNYHHWECIGSLAASTEWKEHSFTGSVASNWVGNDGFISIAFNLSTEPGASCFYIDDVEFEVLRKSNTIPLTPEEKYETIDAELGRWVKGMMDATKGKVKAWNVVTEPLQDGDGDLKLKNATDNPDPNNFYWQDCLGDNYVRNVVKYAREYYAEQEGANASELKLFVNENNLESFENNNAKCTSLMKWISNWEADGTTKIDGIGTQMHVNYYLDAADQAKNEAAIENMFRLLKDSGKLIYISELQVGLVNEIGIDVYTEDATLQQRKDMGNFYKFIIEKYFEIIPEGQQYGICQWSQTDNEKPVGLWNKDYQRMPAYGGFADGLQGK